MGSRRLHDDDDGDDDDDDYGYDADDDGDVLRSGRGSKNQLKTGFEFARGTRAKWRPARGTRVSGSRSSWAPMTGRHHPPSATKQVMLEPLKAKPNWGIIIIIIIKNACF